MHAYDIGHAGQNGHKPKRPQPKRPHTNTATTITATNQNATNQNGHKPKQFNCNNREDIK